MVSKGVLSDIRYLSKLLKDPFAASDMLPDTEVLIQTREMSFLHESIKAKISGFIIYNQ